MIQAASDNRHPKALLKLIARATEAFRIPVIGFDAGRSVATF